MSSIVIGYLSVVGAANYCGINRTTFLERAAQTGLRRFKFPGTHGRVVYKITDLDDWMVQFAEPTPAIRMTTAMAGRLLDEKG